MSRTVDQPQFGVAKPLGPAVASDDTRAVSVVVSVVERPENLCDIYREFSAPLRDAG